MLVALFTQTASPLRTEAMTFVLHLNFFICCLDYCDPITAQAYGNGLLAHGLGRKCTVGVHDSDAKRVESLRP